jgi:hypothetical protein
MSEISKICAAEGCTNILPAYRRKDMLCHEHGREVAQRAPRKRDDSQDLERFRRTLLEETLRSLIQDPSRWTWETGALQGGREGRLTTRGRDRNCCPGWMCGALLDAPLAPGQYCSADCKRRTREAQASFRLELSALRGQLQRCRWCDEPLRISQRGRSRYKQWCNPMCASRYASRQRSLQWLRDKRARTCVQCGRDIPPTRRKGSLTCSADCNRKLQNQRLQERRRAARQSVMA